MSARLTATTAAALAGETVRCAELVFFDFTSGQYRIWRGYGDLIAGSYLWKGLGDVGAISGLDAAINGAAPESTIVLSGVTPNISEAAAKSFNEARGRAMTVYLQFFTATGVLLDTPLPIAILTMERIEVQFTGPALRNVTVHAESMFTARGFPPHGWLSDRDQQARYPGDRGLERMAILQQHAVTWPSPT